MPNRLNISLSPLPERQTLEAWWRELELASNGSFFTSWSWIGSWLEGLPETAAVALLVALRDGRRVGLALAVNGLARVFRRFRVRAWRVHTAGVEDVDDLAIEYNDFLVDRQGADETRLALMQWLLRQTPASQIEVRGAGAPVRVLAEHPPRGLLARLDPLTAYLVSLQKVRAAPQGHLSLLASNLRSQIRRSLKAYGALGPVQVEQAQDLDTALLYLERLRQMHRRSWTDKGVHSGFATDAVAERFHERLIRRAFPRNEVQLLRIRAGDSDIGYLYNFIYRGTVLYYQSGLDYGLVEKHGRPGLVCHVMAIEHNAQLGHTWYDLLAGDYRYKSSLATDQEPMAHCVFMRDTLFNRLELRARQVVQARRRRVADQEVAPQPADDSPTPELQKS